MKDIEVIRELFVLRDDVYALQTRTGYLLIEEPVTDEVIRSHLAGRRKGKPFTIGLYQLGLDNTLKWVVIDLDLDQQKTGAMSDEEAVDAYRPVFKEQIRIIRDTLRSNFDIDLYIEFSGRRGYHLWGFWKEPVLASKAKALFQTALQEVEWLNDDIECELFPKQTRLTEERRYGNLVKLPLGVHQATPAARRCLFVDDELVPYARGRHFYPAQIEFLKSIRRNDPEVVSEYEGGEDEQDVVQAENGSEAQFEFVEDPVKAIYEGCWKTRDLKEKIESEHTITREEKMTTRRLFVSIPGGPEEIHRLESLAQNYSPENTDGHVQAMLRYRYKPPTCGHLCGCWKMRKCGGGSPVWFAYKRQT